LLINDVFKIVAFTFEILLTLAYLLQLLNNTMILY
jgi:hypothetical protein